jgi:hypothetical protein
MFPPAATDKSQRGLLRLLSEVKANAVKSTNVTKDHTFESQEFFFIKCVQKHVPQSMANPGNVLMSHVGPGVLLLKNTLIAE